MNNDWHGKHYAYFQNRACEYFPCHTTNNPDTFNCLFCYCPLYTLGKDCGGACRFDENGIKDCSGCLFPHIPENYGKIVEKYAEICRTMRK